MEIMTKFKNWQYKNTAILILSLIILILIADTDVVKLAISKIGDWGYLGALINGVLFVSVYTIAPATLILFDLAQKLNPYEIAIISGIGAVIGDYVIFRFLKDGVFIELMPLFNNFKWPKFIKIIFKTPYFSWLIPIVGAIIIASPGPDELGISILGASKIKTWQFILLTFLLNSIGIFIIVTIAQIK